MRAADLMSRNIVSVPPEMPVAQAAGCMLQYRISGLPVLDPSGRLVGILTEGDLLRRPELGTDRKRPRWAEFFLSPGTLAQEYVQSHGRRVADVMTSDPVTVGPDTSLEEIVSLMNEHRIKRVPVVQEGVLVGIISRADILRALSATLSRKSDDEHLADTAIRDKILSELKSQSWSPTALINVSVDQGVVDLWGTLLDERERAAIRVAVENVSGVREVRDHLVYVEPYSQIL